MTKKEAETNKQPASGAGKVDTGGGAYIHGDVHIHSGDFVGRDRLETDQPTPAELDAMREGYLASLRKRFEYLDLGGIAPRVQNRTVKLRMDDVFIPVQARPELESRDDEWFDLDDGLSEEIALRMLARRGREGSNKPLEIPDLLSHPRVVILGDPGCGKSTLLRHVAYVIACDKEESIGEAASKRLPIFVRIVQFSQALTQDAKLTLDTYIREVVEPKWSPLFQHALDNGEAFVLLDGLDEVVDAHQRKVISEAIQRLAADYPNNAFLVTSRIVGYQTARLSGDFAHYAIQPLPLESITTFVEKWYAAIEQEAGETELSDEAQKRAEELSRTIQEQLGIRRMAENPLLLTIIALVNWRGRKLPNRRIELYAHAAETLIESWPYRRQGVTLNTERVIRLLSPVAYRIFATRSSGDITEDDLLPILTDAICNVDGMAEHTAQAYARDFLSQISERSGIFRERGYDERGRRVFGFLHLTFAEYFTARYMAGLWEGMEDDDTRRAFLRKYAHVPRWHEVVLLMAGDVGLRDNDRAERATRLLGDILMMNSEYEEHLHRDLLLAGECLSDDLRVQHQAAQYVLDRIMKLVPEPVGYTDISFFYAMRETPYRESILRKLLDYLESDSKYARWRAALALGGFGDTRAVEPLLVHLEDEDESVRAKSARALGALKSKQAIGPLLSYLREDEDYHIRWNATVALGEIGDKQVVEALRVCLEDENRWIRLCAVRALKTLGDSGPIEPVLAQLNDEDSKVRLRAVRTLIGLGDKQAVKPLLPLLEDEDNEVRASTALALGILGDAQVVEPIIARLGDKDADVRWSVAEALGWLGDARAVEPLIERLTDENAWTRWSAAWALGQFSDKRAVKPLIARLTDENQKVRGTVTWSLGKLGDMQAVEPLLAQLEDECADITTKRRVIRALGMIGDKRVIEVLLPLLEESEHWQVRERAYTALLSILSHYALEPTPEPTSCETQTMSGPWDN